MTKKVTPDQAEVEAVAFDPERPGRRKPDGTWETLPECFFDWPREQQRLPVKYPSTIGDEAWNEPVAKARPTAKIIPLHNPPPGTCDPYPPDFFEWTLDERNEWFALQAAKWRLAFIKLNKDRGR